MNCVVCMAHFFFYLFQVVFFEYIFLLLVAFSFFLCKFAHRTNNYKLMSKNYSLVATRMMMVLWLLLCSFSVQAAKEKRDFTVGQGTFLLDGQPFVVKAAEVHYPRIPQPYWEHRIQLCKALGMNTLCLYVFWNIHEQKKGEFDFSGQNDVAAFCRLAQKHGMYVIVRPGPYVCAEWEMGGLPWWLLKKKDIRLRERDDYFMERVKIFEQKVAEQLAPLTIQRGGPIIMVQVENEYGSYGEDKAYVGAIRDVLREEWGKEIALFQCDWSSNFTKNGLDDLVWTMNFGTGANIDEQFKRLGQLRPESPKMCSEFWSGWFDKWGARHETRAADQMVAGMDEMLSKGISFSLYMTHGGTSFGHWAGANSPGFAPDVTSYDYDAPISEWGGVTPKYTQLREMLQRYSDKKLPKIPSAAAPIITVPEFELKEFASIFKAIDMTKKGESPLTFEEMDMGWGMMLYTVSLPQTDGGTLTGEVHDYARYFINGKFIGKTDRVKHEKTIQLPATKKGDRLQILVEGMGRINFGRAIKDYKGIVGEMRLVTMSDGHQLTYELRNWTMQTLPDNYATAMKAMKNADGRSARATGEAKPYHPVLWEATANADLSTQPGYYRGWFMLKKTGDTFLDMSKWGKGVVYVNGHAIGRFWQIGPQQTLYVPGCWLKKGLNEVVVLDMIGPEKPVCSGKATHQLDALQKERTGAKETALTEKKINKRPDLSKIQPVAVGQTKKGNGWQTLSFAQEAKGRYLAIECLSAHDGGKKVAIAEIYAVGKDNSRMSREEWTSFYASHEDAEGGNHTLDKVFDLQESTYWSTPASASTPYLIVIDLGGERTLKAVDYLPRAEAGAPGSVANYRIYVY